MIKYGQQALEVLETIAYFASDNIPVKIFLELANGHIEKWDQCFNYLQNIRWLIWKKA